MYMQGYQSFREAPAFRSARHSGERLLTMMKWKSMVKATEALKDENIADCLLGMPLYMECISLSVGPRGGFDYGQFRAELKKQQFSPQQKSMLNLSWRFWSRVWMEGT